MGNEDRGAGSGSEGESKSWTEQIEVAGGDLVDRIKELIEDASVSRVTIRKEDGDVMMEVPVAVGGAAAGALVLFAPVIAAIGALAAVVAKVRIDIVRESKNDDEPDRASGDGA